MASLGFEKFAVVVTIAEGEWPTEWLWITRTA